ncbi:hypothetical protein [Rhodococcus opacus]|uniref:hypothetical protein n=1 Tax=Rhodococcus opacus TaxID=37919 RepID=UPI0011C4836D|nr:hypothetical protein [Rhodococcus opacus]QZS52834.1 hypothetical protein FXW36_01205 [Rhodococcus opacus]
MRAPRFPSACALRPARVAEPYRGRPRGRGDDPTPAESALAQRRSLPFPSCPSMKGSPIGYRLYLRPCRRAAARSMSTAEIKRRVEAMFADHRAGEDPGPGRSPARPVTGAAAHR